MPRLEPAYSITTFVPQSHLAVLLNAVLEITPLEYGQYDSVAWWSANGVEQFRPLSGANPSSGVAGLLSQLPSVRVEFRIPHDEELLDRVLELGLIPNHPWEEPVILIHEVRVTRNKARGPS